MKRMKKHVSVPSLLKRVRSQFEKVKEPSSRRSKMPLVDCLMSGLAVFGLKFPSLLQFDQGCDEEKIRHNIRALYGIVQAPCDTYLRERLDEVEPIELRRPFQRVWSALQRQKVLERYPFYDDSYLLSLDGTGCFSSSEVHCDSCCVKEHRDGSRTYYHQMLAAVLVHPDEKTVIPMAPEPILKQDGVLKNDCELNAVKRLLMHIRREHPHLKIRVVEDALYGKGPHLKLLKELKMGYIIGVKPKDHAHLFEHVKTVKKQVKETQNEGGTQRYTFVNGAPLNDTHSDLLVNFLEYEEVSAKGKKLKFTWITDIVLTEKNVFQVMKGGRARWKIENETFNTLKNQGYHFDHNFGHGYKNLSTVMAMLMFLAFLIDQAQETCCPLFQKALKQMGRRLYLWNKIRNLVFEFLVDSWESVYEAITHGYRDTWLIPNTS